MSKSKLFLIPKEPARFPLAPNNLPVELGRLVGRVEEVQALCRLLGEASSEAGAQEPRVRLLTLVGPGGVGKTRLALQVAEEMLQADVFEDAVYFVELASVVEADQLVPAIAATLQLREVPGTPLISTLRAWFPGKRVLLVLDNFEQIMPADVAMYIITELLAASLDLKIIVTSRSTLGLHTEYQYELS